MKPVLLGAALLMLAIVSASAAPFSALYAFGDSLSDAGNTFSATGGATPPAPPNASVGVSRSRRSPDNTGWTTDGLPRSPKVDAAGINRSTNVPLNQT